MGWDRKDSRVCLKTIMQTIPSRGVLVDWITNLERTGKIVESNVICLWNRSKICIGPIFINELQLEKSGCTVEFWNMFNLTNSTV